MPEEKKKEIIESEVVESRLPRQEPPKPVKVEVDDFKLGVLYTLYVFYKSNLITRNNLREMIAVMNAPPPEKGVGKYIVEEAAKG